MELLRFRGSTTELPHNPEYGDYFDDKPTRNMYWYNGDSWMRFTRQEMEDYRNVILETTSQFPETNIGIVERKHVGHHHVPQENPKLNGIEMSHMYIDEFKDIVIHKGNTPVERKSPTKIPKGDYTKNLDKKRYLK